MLHKFLEEVCADAMEEKEFAKMSARNTYVLSVFFGYQTGCIFLPL